MKNIDNLNSSCKERIYLVIRDDDEFGFRKVIKYRAPRHDST